MKKKSLISMVVALCLTGAVMVGATLAYLTAETQEVTNVFTIGNVNITLEEPSWNPEDGLNLTPGATVAKDPTVTNTGANDAYIAVTVKGMDDMAAAGFAAVVNDGWVKVNADGTVDADWTGAVEDGVYAYTSALAAEGVTTALFSEVAYTGVPTTTEYVVEAVAKDAADESQGVYYVVKDAAGALVTDKQFDTEEAAKAFLSGNTVDGAATRFELKVQAYAIQTTGLDLVDANGAYAWVDEIDFK